MDRVSFTSVRFSRFKALNKFSLSLTNFNVLVGANNSGKSTIVGAFRALEIAVRKAKARKAERVLGPSGLDWGWHITSDDLPISLENVHSNYEEADSTVTFRLSNRVQLYLFFPAEEGCVLIVRDEMRALRTPAKVRVAIPFEIGVVPVLGPLEREEKIVTDKTVRLGLPTHRASRHFRNYWLKNPAQFDEFSDLIRVTWPGMEIEPPEVVPTMESKLAMFCREDRISRELYWAGFGFQVWCQLLTHLLRSKSAAIVVVDEPEIYLHPDLQRKLISILRRLGPDVLLATHSTEIMAEVDPSDLVLIDKAKSKGERMKDLESVQGAIDQIGSVHNVALSQLARTRRVLFVEGAEDFKRIRRFAQVLGLEELATGLDVTPVESGGFARWKEIFASAWGIEQTIGTSLRLGAVFDSDYWPKEEIDSISTKLEQRLEFVRVLSRKEIENYMLVPSVLERTVEKWVNDRARRTGEPPPSVEDISELLERETEPLKDYSQAQYLAKRLAYLEKSKSDGGKDQATRTEEGLRWFSDSWNDLSRRLEIVPGKKLLARLRSAVNGKYSISLSDSRIITAFKPSEVPSDLKELLADLEEFRKETDG